MNSKLIRARESILQFVKTANPEDEFFVIGFNDRPELIEDFTSSVEDIQARLATVRSGHRTALLDAIYLRRGQDEGGASTSARRCWWSRTAAITAPATPRAKCGPRCGSRTCEIYSIGIFDPYAATPEERTGPMLLNELCEETGGRLFRVDDLARWATSRRRFPPNYGINM